MHMADHALCDLVSRRRYQYQPAGAELSPGEPSPRRCTFAVSALLRPLPGLPGNADRSTAIVLQPFGNQSSTQFRWTVFELTSKLNAKVMR